MMVIYFSVNFDIYAMTFMRSLSFIMNSGVCGMHFGPSIMTEIWGQELCPDFVIIILLDGGPCHTARATTSWLNSNKVCVIPAWPTNSPDLNPIEMIWGIMKRKVKWKDTVRNGDEMFAELQRVWKEIEKETINKLVLSFYDRCQIVLHMGGESASAHLRARRPVPIGPLPEIVTDWSDDEDKRLLELYAAHGDRWQHYYYYACSALRATRYGQAARR